MGFLDKLISKLDDNDPNQHKPMAQQPLSSHYQGQPQYSTQQGGYASAGYQQHGFGGDQQGAQGYVHPPPQGQGQGYDAGNQYQGYNQGQGYGHVDRESHPSHPAKTLTAVFRKKLNTSRLPLATSIKTQTAQILLQTFQTQLTTAQTNLQTGPTHDPGFKTKMETEVKILMAVVGVCQGFVNGTEGLSEGMRGMGVGGGEGYGMMPNQGYAPQG